MQSISDINQKMVCAAKTGNIEIVRLCKNQGATDFDNAMMSAVSAGYIEIIHLCKDWGATDIDIARWYVAAERTGHNTDIVQLCKNQGCRRFQQCAMV